MGRLIHEGNRIEENGCIWVKTCPCRGPSEMDSLTVKGESRGDFFIIRAVSVHGPVCTVCTVCGVEWKLESVSVPSSGLSLGNVP